MGNIVNVRSEIGRLKKVLTHRPGEELLNLVPDYLGEMLFDDIPWLAQAQVEHDAFTDTLRNLGVEVVYLIDLVEQSIKNDAIRLSLVNDYLAETQIYSDSLKRKVVDHLLQMPLRQMIACMIAGMRKKEIPQKVKAHLSDYLKNDYPFIIPPMPNCYFSRDPFSFVGGGVIECSMNTLQRSRETLFAKYIFAFHPDYNDCPKYYRREMNFSMEGGDILVLDEHTLAIGISQRTHANAIEDLAKNILDGASGFTKIIAIDIPKQRTFMHLDTVFTMLDKGVFSIHPNTESSFRTLEVTKVDGKTKIQLRDGRLDEILAEILGLDSVKLIKCGGNNVIDAAREQWNDGANTLAVAPGEVVVYARNNVTNQLFLDNGIKVHEIPCSELSRGRGGPRCMTMPIIRE